MTMYHTNFYIMMAAISVVAQNEAPEAEEEQEESSDYKCTLCEQFKNNPKPRAAKTAGTLKSTLWF